MKKILKKGMSGLMAVLVCLATPAACLIGAGIASLLPSTVASLNNTGAHGFSMGYNYNGKLRSAELLLREDGSVKLIRRAETPADYFATFDFANKNYEL